MPVLPCKYGSKTQNAHHFVIIVFPSPFSELTELEKLKNLLSSLKFRFPSGFSAGVVSKSAGQVEETREGRAPGASVLVLRRLAGGAGHVAHNGANSAQPVHRASQAAARLAAAHVPAQGAPDAADFPRAAVPVAARAQAEARDGVAPAFAPFAARSRHAVALDSRPPAQGPRAHGTPRIPAGPGQLA